jgi:tetratricopeptide (TPR) repeat protein
MFGEAFWRAKRYPETLGQFKKALKVNPKYAYTHLNLGKAFDLVNDKANAIAHTRFVVKLFRVNRDKNGEAKAKQKLNQLYK